MCNTVTWFQNKYISSCLVQLKTEGEEGKNHLQKGEGKKKKMLSAFPGEKSRKSDVPLWIVMEIYSVMETAKLNALIYKNQLCVCICASTSPELLCDLKILP